MWSGILGALVVLPGQASAGPREDFDKRIVAELRARDAAAAALFERANEAREQNDHASAERLYGEVFAKAPQFFHAERRRCGLPTLRCGRGRRCSGLPAPPAAAHRHRSGTSSRR